MIQAIDGVDDPRVADYRHLSDRALVQDRGLFIAEGRLVVQRVVESGRFTVHSVLVSPTALRQMGPTLAGLSDSVPVFVCPATAFAGITGYDIHRGCLAIVERPAQIDARQLLDASVGPLVIGEAIANPDNIGGIFRNAAAFGAGAVLLDPASCDPLYRKAIRTSMASTLAVPFARLTPWPSALGAVREREFTVVALTPRHDAEPLASFAARVRGRRLALMVGSEAVGLSDGALSFADARVRIDIDPTVDSLNVAVAVGIALHTLR